MDRDIEPGIIVHDDRDPLGRAAVRCDVDITKRWVMLDLCKKYSGTNAFTEEYTEPVKVRYLGTKAAKELGEWLVGMAELLEGSDG